jgi:mono/diheme cytochrome c family protein
VTIRVIAAVSLLWAGGTALIMAQSATPAAPRVTPSARTTSMAAADTARHRTWVKQNCVSCHNEKSPQPAAHPVRLDNVNFDDVIADAETWERVLRKLSVRAMPPAGLPRPSEAEYAGFTRWLSDALDRGWAARPTTPGRYVVHRLNRAEYRNAIRDLLALDVDVSALLPNDGGDHGFDNIASALRTSPLLLDGYLTAAQRISTLAVGDVEARPTTAEYVINRDYSQNERVEGLPIGTRGGRRVRHVFPADGEYKLFGRLVRGIEEGYAGVEGHDLPHTFVITVDGAEVYSAEIGGPEDHKAQAKSMNDVRPIIDARMTARVKITAGPHDIGFTFRERPGQAQDVWQPALRDSQEIHMTGGLPKLKTVGIEGPYDVTGVSATASRERIFICQPAQSQEARVAAVAAKTLVQQSPRRSSPESTASEDGCARRILTTLARRAFRRQVTAEDLEPVLSFYRSTRERGGQFEAGIRAGLARILVSPLFIYRIERDPAGARAGSVRRVTDVELASRLSFFLWSSIPDERLLNLAIAGRLREPGVLTAEVRRMVADSRADSFVANFAGQWLQLRNLESKVRPDILAFPDFDDNIREAFRRETELLFANVLRENRSVLELLSADYSFVNERLARHYGIPGVYGSRFRKVTLTDPNRHGLLGHGSILSMTSIATRNSPVFRGKFILSTFLNTPPPEPPANVPALEDAASDASKPKTVREQLEVHRRSPVCASCHRAIDPPGFALEKFNPVGQWRETTPDGTPIDTAGVMADGSKVDGPVALRQSILSRPDAFTTVVTERLMTYALGRGLEPSDMPVVRAIVARARPTGYKFETIIRGIVESAPFQMRTVLEAGAEQQSSRVEQP